MGKVKAYLQQLMDDESSFLYAIFYHTSYDLEIKGVYMQCDSIWFIEEKFKNEYPNCTITQIECMNSIIELRSNGKLLHTTRFLLTLNKYLKHYRSINVSIKVNEIRQERG